MIAGKKDIRAVITIVDENKYLFQENEEATNPAALTPMMRKTPNTNKLNKNQKIKSSENIKDNLNSDEINNK